MLESLTTTVQAWSPRSRREARPLHAPTEHVATNAQHLEEGRLFALNDAYTDDYERASTGDAIKEATAAQRADKIPRRAIDWAKWDALMSRDGDVYAPCAVTSG